LIKFWSPRKVNLVNKTEWKWSLTITKC